MLLPSQKKRIPHEKQSDALISRIASKIAERCPKVEGEAKKGEHEKEKATTKAKQGEEAGAGGAATAAAAPAQAPKAKKKKPSPPPPSAQKAAAPKREKQQKQQKQQPTQKKSKTSAKAKKPKARNSSLLQRPSLSLDDFAAAEAAVASGFAATKKRAKRAEATAEGASAEA